MGVCTADHVRYALFVFAFSFSFFFGWEDIQLYYGRGVRREIRERDELNVYLMYDVLLFVIVVFFFGVFW